MNADGEEDFEQEEAEGAEITSNHFSAVSAASCSKSSVTDGKDRVALVDSADADVVSTRLMG